MGESADGKKNDGGCAFPVNGLSPGMSLRDYFAVRIVNAIIAVDGAWKYEDGAESRLAQANLAYSYADALLKARGG